MSGVTVILEYLPTGSPDCPLIRLFQFRSNEAAAIQRSVAELSAGRLESVAVHAQPGVTSVDGCQLVFRVWNYDQAILQLKPLVFECRLTADSWNNVAGLMEPFAAEEAGYQWLVATPGEAWLLLSVSGQW